MVLILINYQLDNEKMKKLHFKLVFLFSSIIPMFKYFFLLVSCLLSAQTITVTPIASIQAPYEVFWSMDALNFFYCSNQNDIHKISQEKKWVYTSNLGGKLTDIDAFNGLNIFLFYKNTNTVVVLDTQLNPIQTVTSNDWLLDWIKPASQSEFWFFDSLTQKIGLYNLNKKAFRFLSNAMQPKIKYTCSDYNKLYWINEENELNSIDKFGSIKYLGKVPLFDQISFDGSANLIYSREGVLYSFNWKESKIEALSVQEKRIKNFCFKEGILAIFTENQITNYQLKF